MTLSICDNFIQFQNHLNKKKECLTEEFINYQSLSPSINDWMSLNFGLEYGKAQKICARIGI